MMKKIIILLITLVLIMNIVGCSKEENEAHVSKEEMQNNINTFYNNISNKKCVYDYDEEVSSDSFDTVTFGSYPQNDDKEKTKEPIEWFVLNVDNEEKKVLLLSKYILDCKRYNDRSKDVTWEDSSIRDWLNKEFYNDAFNEIEKEIIIASELANDDNSGTHYVGGSPAHPELSEPVEFISEGGNDTIDKIFLLSVDEVEDFFNFINLNNANKQIEAKGTIYAKENGLSYDTENVDAEWYTGASSYWLRGPGTNNREAMFVIEDGTILYQPVEWKGIGVRPAMWVSIENSEIDNSNKDIGKDEQDKDEQYKAETRNDIEDIEETKMIIVNPIDDAKSSKDIKENEDINNKTYYDYIENIDVKYNNIGKSVGYQIYDINNDGIDELILYGRVDTNDIINITNYNNPPFRLVCLPFIDKIYTTKNGEVIPFEIYNGMNGTVKDGNVLNAFFGLNGEKVALYNVVDEKIKSIKVIDYINGNIKNIPLDKNIDKAYYEEIDAEYYNLEKQETDQYEEEYNEIYSSIGHVNGWDGLDVIYDTYNDKNIQEKHTYKERGERRIYKKNSEEITSDNDTYNVSLKIKDVAYSNEEISITAVLEDSINKAPYIEYVQGSNGGAKTTHYSYLDNGIEKSIQSKFELIGLNFGMSYTQALVDLECQYNQELTFDIPLYSLNRPINNHCKIDYCGYIAEFDIVENNVNINKKDSGKNKDKDKDKDKTEEREISNIELLYTDVIKSIKDEVNIYEPGDDITPVGVTTYAGHQFYDMDGDGEFELIIYRNEAYGKVFIDSVYEIENGKPKIFDLSKYGSSDVYESYLQSDYKSGGTRDIVYYALTDGRVAKVYYHWGSMEDFIQIYGFPGSSIEDVNDSKFLSMIGYFPCEIINKNVSSNNTINKNVDRETVEQIINEYFPSMFMGYSGETVKVFIDKLLNAIDIDEYMVDNYNNEKISLKDFVQQCKKDIHYGDNNFGVFVDNVDSENKIIDIGYSSMVFHNASY